MIGSLDWMTDAACRGVPTGLFFPESAGENAVDARAVCMRCPVRAECVDYAETNREKFGIWGGVSFAMSPRKRRKQLQRQEALFA